VVTKNLIQLLLMAKKNKTHEFIREQTQNKNKTVKTVLESFISEFPRLKSWVTSNKTHDFNRGRKNYEPMPKLFLLFSHYITEEQFQDAKKTLNITDFVSLPKDLQQRFSNVPADLETIDEYLKPILDWIDEQCTDYNDYILVQGDFGATYFLVDYCKNMNYATPIYATTERKSIEEVQEDGSIKTQRIFKHKRFRLY